jgi:hypothetical protein
MIFLFSILPVQASFSLAQVHLDVESFLHRNPSLIMVIFRKNFVQSQFILEKTVEKIKCKFIFAFDDIKVFFCQNHPKLHTTCYMDTWKSKEILYR